MSFGIVFELFTSPSNGNAIFFKETFATITEIQVATMNTIERYGLLKGLNKQFPIFDRSQNDLPHHEIGIS